MKVLPTPAVDLSTTDAASWFGSPRCFEDITKDHLATGVDLAPAIAADFYASSLCGKKKIKHFPIPAVDLPVADTSRGYGWFHCVEDDGIVAEVLARPGSPELFDSAYPTKHPVTGSMCS